MIRDSARAYATKTTEPEIFTKMGLLGITIRDTYRGLGAGFVTYGLVAREGELWTADTGRGCRYQSVQKIIADGSSDITRQRSRTFGRVEGCSRD